MQDSVIRESWHAWEASLRAAHRMQRVGAVALWGESSGPLVWSKRLTEEEWERFEKWKR